MSKVIAIHQPNFLPWLGFFDKINRADAFILLDSVQFPKKGGTWTNHVRMLVNGSPNWVTVPVDRSFHGTRRIDEMLIDDKKNWREKILKTVQMSYARAPYFSTIFPLLQPLIGFSTQRIAEYNVNILLTLIHALGWNDKKIVLASSLNVATKATDMLVDLVKALGGSAYLCGGGASGYQEDDKFSEAGIDLIYQYYQHPVYRQSNTSEFVPGLSIVDTLMNCGMENTRSLLEGTVNLQ